MKKRKKILFLCLLSFFLSGLFAASFYLAEGIFPGSEKLILIYDELNQYSGIWGYSRYYFSNSSNFFYNWSSCLGGNNICQMAYYNGNPINLIISLFPIKDIPDIVYFLTISKFSFAGLSFCVYLLLCRREVINERIILLLSLCYSMMSYMVMYSMSLMWLDAVILLPIVIAGLERLISKRKVLLFVVSLTLLFYTNFYIGYMTVIFSLLYFVWFEIRQKSVKRKIAADFGIYSLSGIIAAMLSAPYLLPTIMGLSLGKGAEETSFALKTTVSLWKILGKVFSCQYDTITSQGSPSLFVGTAVLILALLSFFDMKNKTKEKIAGALILLFLVISFWIKPLYMVWHGFNEPICFPARFSFVFSFFILILALDGINFACCIFENKKSNAVYVTIRKYVVPLFYILTVVELWINASFVIGWLRIEVKTISRSEYEEIVTGTESILKEISDEDKLAYRIDGTDTIGRNDAMLFGYKGLSCFTSTYNNDLNELIGKLGICQHDYSIFSENALPLAMDLLSCKYYYAKNDNSVANMSKTDEAEGYSLYLNEDCLPVGFRVDSFENVAASFDDNVFENNNKLTELIAGIESIFIENELEIDKVYSENGDNIYQLTVTAKQAGPVYLFFNADCRKKDKTVKDNPKKENEHLFLFKSPAYARALMPDGEVIDMENLGFVPFYISDCEKDEKLSFQIESSFNLNEGFSYSLDSKRYEEVIDKLSECRARAVNNPDGIYSCVVDCNEDCNMFFSIPCIEGIKAYIDGKEANIIKVYDSFSGLSLSAGKHQIDFRYTVPGLFSGIILLILGIMGLVAWEYICVNKDRRRADE